MKTIHFFDVDKTITSRLTGLEYLSLGIRRGIFPFRPLFSVPGLMLKYRVGELSLDQFYRDGIPFLVGKQHTTLVTLAEDVFRKNHQKSIYPQALALIRTLQAQHQEVVLATSSIDLVLAPLIRYLGIGNVIASTLEFEDERCTGRFAGAPVFSTEKSRRVLSYIQANNALPGDCYFYSDSIHDLSLLEAVGHPVAVNPDKKLGAVAAQRGWQVLSFKR